MADDRPEEHFAQFVLLIQEVDVRGVPATRIASENLGIDVAKVLLIVERWLENNKKIYKDEFMEPL